MVLSVREDQGTAISLSLRIGAPKGVDTVERLIIPDV